MPTQAASATLDGVVPDGIVGTDGQPIKDIASIKTELEARAKIIEELQKPIIETTLSQILI